MKTIQQRGLREPGQGQGAAHPKSIREETSYRFTEAQFQAMVRALWNELAPTAERSESETGAGVRSRRGRRRPSLGRRMAQRVYSGKHV